MAHLSLRFVHTGPLRLDAPLRGMGLLTSDMRRLAEDATLIAWERVVEACLERSADFLLISGAVFDRPPTIRAQRAFAEGCAALDEFDVSVFVDDPGLIPDAVTAFPLPENVRILDGDATAVWTGPQRRTAHVTPFRAEFVAHAIDSESDGEAFRIVIAGEPDEVAESALAGEAGRPFDYAAVGGLSARLTTTETGGVLHAPGVAQGLQCCEAGPHGGSLVEIDAAGGIDVTPLPTAAVRWETFSLEPDAAATRPQIIDRMRSALLGREAAVGERLWIVQWRCECAGQRYCEDLADEGAFLELCHDMEAGLGGQAGPERLHRRELQGGAGDEVDSLLREFQRVVNGPAFDGELAALQRLAPERRPTVDESAVRATAARLGRLWLAGAGDRPPGP